jgi:hypothetical protein
LAIFLYLKIEQIVKVPLDKHKSSPQKQHPFSRQKYNQILEKKNPNNLQLTTKMSVRWCKLALN